MAKLTYKDLLDAGVHFGHLTRKWDPHMAPYIFMERNGIHIVDLNKTLACLEEASNAVKNIVRSGRKIMFVATKKQAKGVVEEEAVRLKMPYVAERWLGGMLTNFTTIRKSLKKLSSIEKLMKDESYLNLAKRERLMITREKDKLEKVLGGISDLTRLPAAVFIVDIKKEHIAVKEAQKLNIPIVAIVDTNSNPNDVDFPIPGNDDAFKSIDIIVRHIAQSVEEGLMERKKDKEDQKLKEEEEAKRKLDEGKETTEEKPRRERRVRIEKESEKPSGEVKEEKQAGEGKAEKEPVKDQEETDKADSGKKPEEKVEKEVKKEDTPSAEARTEKEEKKEEAPAEEAGTETKEKVKSESQEDASEKAEVKSSEEK